MAMAELKRWGLRNNQIVRFRRVHLKDDDLDELIPYILAARDHVYEIDLKYNLLSDKGAKCIGELCAHLPKLTRLCLACNQIGDEGICVLVDLILWYGKTIVDVHLEGNKIGTNGINAIIRLIKEHCSLRVLYIQGNKWTNEDTNKIIAALVGNQTMAGICLPIGSAEELLKMELFKQFLSQNTTLFRLYYAPASEPPFFPSLICERDEAAGMWMECFYIMWKLVIVWHANSTSYSNVLLREILDLIFHFLALSSRFTETQAKQLRFFKFDSTLHYILIIDNVFGRGVGFYIYHTLPKMGFWRDEQARTVLDERYWGDVPEWRG